MSGRCQKSRIVESIKYRRKEPSPIFLLCVFRSQQQPQPAALLGIVQSLPIKAHQDTRHGRQYRPKNNSMVSRKCLSKTRKNGTLSEAILDSRLITCSSRSALVSSSSFDRSFASAHSVQGDGVERLRPAGTAEIGSSEVPEFSRLCESFKDLGLLELVDGARIARKGLGGLDGSPPIDGDLIERKGLAGATRGEPLGGGGRAGADAFRSGVRESAVAVSGRSQGVLSSRSLRGTVMIPRCITATAIGIHACPRKSFVPTTS